MREEKQLKRVLGRWELVGLGIGAIIGAGIFVLTGQAAAQYAGPAITVSFILSGVVCALAGLCYAELASLLPVSGSAYTYAKASLGNFLAWIIGWDLILEYFFAAATVAVGWSGYMTSFLNDIGIPLPQQFASAPLSFDHIQGWQTTGAILNLPAMFIIGILTALLIIGIQESIRANTIIVLIKITVILLFIGFGAHYVHTENWTPFIPKNTGTFGQFGWSGIARGAAVIFFAYIGFDAVSTAAQESSNPQKDMPFGILGSLIVCTILYILVALVLTGIVKYTHLHVPDPIAVGVNAAGEGLSWLRPLVKIGALAGLTSVILVMLMGQTRIFYSMAKDGYLPSVFAKIHKKFQTPYLTTLVIGILAMIVAGIFPIGILGELVSIGTLFAFAIVCISVWILRKKQPTLTRHFRTPWVPFVPILGALTAIGQILSLPKDTWMRLLIWMAIGLVIYYTYGRHHVKKTDFFTS